MPIAMPSYSRPLESARSLAKLAQVDLTPAIGTEFPSTVSLRALLDDRQAIRDLAILVSQRGVVFFREQDLTVEEQLKLVDLMGRETGRPRESSLHIHPLTSSTDELGAVFKITAGTSQLALLLLETQLHVAAWMA
jgi:alpha-ketoglutarate-dependent taurine dioxygenase